MEMSTIIQAIQNEEISRLNTLLALVKCTESNSKYLFMAITHTKPKASKAIFEHCNQQFSNAAMNTAITLLKQKFMLTIIQKAARNPMQYI